MGVGKQSSWNAIAITAMSLILFTGCAANNSDKQAKNPAISAREATIEAKKEEAAEKSKQIAQLKKEKADALAKSEAAKKKIPYLLSESDGQLRLAQQYQNNAAKQKDAGKKSDLQERASKAQAAADQKSKDMVALRAELYAELDKARVADKKIQVLVAQKERAEKIAKAEADLLAKVKQTSGKPIARGNSNHM